MRDVFFFVAGWLIGLYTAGFLIVFAHELDGPVGYFVRTWLFRL